MAGRMAVSIATKSTQETECVFLIENVEIIRPESAGPIFGRSMGVSLRYPP
jgi:hypothetical protein